MATVTIHNAKTNLSRLLADVEAGKEVVIARGKTPIAKLVAINDKPKRVAGRYKGQFKVPPEFFEPMSDEELALWYDGKIF
jgi:antitoxin (DNA-binding transcriptional repressor) of toxin-antitoxin stability system